MEVDRKKAKYYYELARQYHGTSLKPQIVTAGIRSAILIEQIDPVFVPVIRICEQHY